MNVGKYTFRNKPFKIVESLKSPFGRTIQTPPKNEWSEQSDFPDLKNLTTGTQVLWINPTTKMVFALLKKSGTFWESTKGDAPLLGTDTLLTDAFVSSFQLTTLTTEDYVEIRTAGSTTVYFTKGTGGPPTIPPVTVPPIPPVTDPKPKPTVKPEEETFWEKNGLGLGIGGGVILVLALFIWARSRRRTQEPTIIYRQEPRNGDWQQQQESAYY